MKINMEKSFRNSNSILYLMVPDMCQAIKRLGKCVSKNKQGPCYKQLGENWCWENVSVDMDSAIKIYIEIITKNECDSPTYSVAVMDKKYNKEEKVKEELINSVLVGGGP